MSEAQIAVLIDFENVGLQSIQPMFDQLSDLGRIIVKRAYADWSSSSNKRDQLLQLGIEAIHQFHSSGSAKNAIDIRLAIDAVDMLYGSPVDTFVILSSDSDFVPLVSRLRSAGKSVIGAGRRAVVSRTLVTSCDRYIYLDDLEETPTEEPMMVKEETESLLMRGFQASRDDQGKVKGGKLHETIRRIDPSFDFRAFGYNNFTQFLKGSKLVKVSRTTRQGDVTVEMSEADLLRPNNSKSRLSMSKDNVEARSDAVGGEAWEQKVDISWSAKAKKSGDSVAGSWAGTEAAKALGDENLKSSRFPTIDKLLGASEYLSARWRRERNTVVRLESSRGMVPAADS